MTKKSEKIRDIVFPLSKKVRRLFMQNNPYCNNEGTWLRGSFHGHCLEHSACASIPLAESVANYENIGAGFVAITDHDHITDLSETEKNHPNLGIFSTNLV